MKTLLLRRVLMAMAVFAIAAGTLHAQEQRTLRELTAVPDDALQTLEDAGADLTQELMDSLLTAHLDTENEYKVVAVVLTDPLNSGLASWNDDRGGPSRVHIWVRDTAAATQGNASMSLQIVDGAYEDNSTLDIAPGDVIEMTGFLGTFTNSVQFSPNSIVFVGSYTDLGLPETLVQPDTITTSDITKNVGEGVYQANWLNYNMYNGGYICIKDGVLFRRAVTGSREDWSVTSDNGETTIVTYDMSLRYRNDRTGSYQAPFNVLDEPFVPPAVGASTDVCGTVIHQPFNDPFAQTSPTDAMLSLVPWEDSDLTIKASPPQFTAPLTTPEVLVGSDQAYRVEADVTFDPEREPAGANLYYYTAATAGESFADTLSVPMTNTEGTIWAADIPPLGTDRLFVVYWADATDNTGATSVSDEVSFRVFDTAVQSLSEIQEAVIPGPNSDWPSPLEGLDLAFDLAVTVQSQPDVSGLVSVQDNADLDAWSGMMLDISPDGLTKGQELVIASAEIEEQFGVTRLTNIVLGEPTGKVQDALPYKEVNTANLADELTAEQHEGMLVKINNVRIVSLENFGEWTFTNSDDDNAVLGDDASAADLPPFDVGDEYDFLQGIWWYSFGTYKIVPEDGNDFGGGDVAVERVGEVPGAFALRQNYPNPFNPSTMISYDIPSSEHVTLQVFDVTGKVVATLVDQEMGAGAYEVSFDARDLASGLYVYRLQAGENVQTAKMLLMR